MENEFDALRRDVQQRLLLAEIVALTGESEGTVVMRALEERLARLTRPVSAAERRQRVLNVLETSLWRHRRARDVAGAIDRDEEDRVLGYGPEGV